MGKAHGAKIIRYLSITHVLFQQIQSLLGLIPILEIGAGMLLDPIILVDRIFQWRC